MTERGKFIVFEGVDGSGTTTLTNYIGDKIETKFGKNSVVKTFEPSKLDIGVFLRKILQGKKTVGSDLSMAYLFMADRADHTSRIILPAIENGKHVVCDRYYVSTLVYQSAKEDFAKSLNAMEGIFALMRGQIEPDLPILLDCGVEVSKERREKREGVKEIYETEHYQRFVSEMYRVVFSKHIKNSQVVNAEESLVSVKAKTWSIVNELFS